MQNTLSLSLASITFLLLQIWRISASPTFILEGSRLSFVRFPKWYHSFENVLSFEFKTKQPNGLLMYTDDGGAGNFYEIRLVDGELQLQMRLGNQENEKFATKFEF